MTTEKNLHKIQLSMYLKEQEIFSDGGLPVALMTFADLKMLFGRANS